jgi:hypothetical protein
MFGFVITQIQGDGESFVLFRLSRGRAHWLVLILAYVSGMTFYQRSILGKSIVSWISNDQVAKLFDLEKLNIGNIYGMAKEKKGSMLNLSKVFIEIKFSQNGITIRSANYNFLNGDGFIFIPKEIENYDQIKNN